MFISSPIPQLAIILSIHFKDHEDTKYCIDYFEDVSTTRARTDVELFDERLEKFVQRLNKEMNLVFYTASFISFYFNARGEKEMADMYKKLMNENIEHHKVLDALDAGFLSGIFLACLLSDAKITTDIKIPEDIASAVKYIETNNFIVHLEKHDETRT